MSTDAIVLFKEWLPDLPDLENPGLIEAFNVLPVDQTYRNYAPIQGVYGTMLSVPSGSIWIDRPGDFIVYAGDVTSLRASTAGSFTNLSASTYGATAWDFEVFEGVVYAADINTPIQRHTIGSAGNFAVAGSSAGTAPPARAIGKVGQFLVAGYVNFVPYKVQWPAIGNPESWPTPNSATAIGAQAGEQYLDDWGGVRAIGGGDQFGIIWQPGGMHRMTYIGGSAVFQFDRISRSIGTHYPRSIVHVAGIWYFLSQAGVHATDGVNIIPIGAGKVDRWFLSQLASGFEEYVTGTVDTVKKLVLWSFPTTGGALGPTSDAILAYNYEEKRFTRAGQISAGLIPREWNLGLLPAAAFDADRIYGQFTGAPAVPAQLITGEQEANPGRYTHINGIKPLVAATANAVSIAIGARNTQSASVTFSNATYNTRTDFYNLRNEARYQRARVTISGTFNSAQGIEVDAVQSGEA